MYRRLPRGLAALTIEMARNADLGATRAPLLNLSKPGQRPSAPRVSPLTNLSVFLKNLQLVAAKVSKPKFRENSGNSLDFSKVLFQSGMSWFESSKVSQAVRCSEKGPLILAERLANGVLLRISHQSPGSDFGHSQSEIADSLRRTFEKLPFLGDCGRRPGSICMGGRACSATRQIFQHGRRQIGHAEPPPVAEFALQIAKFSSMAAGQLKIELALPNCVPAETHQSACRARYSINLVGTLGFGR
jgi:hypothetical protein